MPEQLVGGLPQGCRQGLGQRGPDQNSRGQFFLIATEGRVYGPPGEFAVTQPSPNLPPLSCWHYRRHLEP